MITVRHITNTLKVSLKAVGAVQCGPWQVAMNTDVVLRLDVQGVGSWGLHHCTAPSPGPRYL